MISIRAKGIEHDDTAYPSLQQNFVPQNQKLPWTTKEKLVAFPCPLGMVKYIEPVSDIIHFDPWNRLEEKCGRPEFGYRSLSLPRSVLNHNHNELDSEACRGPRCDLEESDED